MTPLYEFSPDRPVLVVPDIHQDIGFLDRAVALAGREGAALCFLGDYVDAVNPRWRGEAALRAVAERLAELALQHRHGCVFLAGNHDVDALRLAHNRARLLLSGDEEVVARLDAAQPSARGYAHLLGVWPAAFLRTWGLVATAHGHLLSHAGVSRRLWPWEAAPTPELQAQTLVRQGDDAWSAWLEQGKDSPFFAVGPARGGRTEPVGGPLWLDWQQEFVDDLPLPQLVGHSRGQDPRRKDRSWCLDAAQSAVCLLDPELDLTVLRI